MKQHVMFYFGHSKDTKFYGQVVEVYNKNLYAVCEFSTKNELFRSQDKRNVLGTYGLIQEMDDSYVVDLFGKELFRKITEEEYNSVWERVVPK